MITYEELKTIRFRVTHAKILQDLGLKLNKLFNPSRFRKAWAAPAGNVYYYYSGSWKCQETYATHTDAELLEILEGKRTLNNSPKEIGYIW